MHFFTTILHIVLCITLILIILLQPGKGAGSVFGGGASAAAAPAFGAAAPAAAPPAFAATPTFNFGGAAPAPAPAAGVFSFGGTPAAAAPTSQPPQSPPSARHSPCPARTAGRARPHGRAPRCGAGRLGRSRWARRPRDGPPRPAAAAGSCGLRTHRRDDLSGRGRSNKSKASREFDREDSRVL